MAAWWQTAWTQSSAASSAGPFRSPMTYSTSSRRYPGRPSWALGCRTSSTRTRCPRLASSSTTWLPTNPAPPVTSTSVERGSTVARSGAPTGRLAADWGSVAVGVATFGLVGGVARRAAGDPDGELAAAAGVGDLDPPTVRLDQAARDRQAEPGAVARAGRVTPPERVEHPGQRGLGDAAALVGDPQQRRLAGALGADQHAPARWGVADAVGDQVGEHPTDLLASHAD